MAQYKYQLDETDLPHHWYNIAADMAAAGSPLPPPIHPTPVYRAHRLEKALQTPAHLYYKYEGVSPAGSHKPNTAVAQAYYNREAGIRRLTTETGAGQWGSALAEPSGLVTPAQLSSEWPRTVT